MEYVSAPYFPSAYGSLPLQGGQLDRFHQVLNEPYRLGDKVFRLRGFLKFVPANSFFLTGGAANFILAQTEFADLDGRCYVERKALCKVHQWVWKFCAASKIPFSTFTFHSSPDSSSVSVSAFPHLDLHFLEEGSQAIRSASGSEGFEIHAQRLWYRCLDQNRYLLPRQIGQALKDLDFRIFRISSREKLSSLELRCSHKLTQGWTIYPSFLLSAASEMIRREYGLPSLEKRKVQFIPAPSASNFKKKISNYLLKHYSGNSEFSGTTQERLINLFNLLILVQEDPDLCALIAGSFVPCMKEIGFETSQEEFLSLLTCNPQLTAPLIAFISGLAVLKFPWEFYYTRLPWFCKNRFLYLCLRKTKKLKELALEALLSVPPLAHAVQQQPSARASFERILKCLGLEGAQLEEGYVIDKWLSFLDPIFDTKLARGVYNSFSERIFHLPLAECLDLLHLNQELKKVNKSDKNWRSWLSLLKRCFFSPTEGDATQFKAFFRVYVYPGTPTTVGYPRFFGILKHLLQKRNPLILRAFHALIKEKALPLISDHPELSTLVACVLIETSCANLDSLNAALDLSPLRWWPKFLSYPGYGLALAKTALLLVRTQPQQAFQFLRIAIEHSQDNLDPLSFYEKALTQGYSPTPEEMSPILKLFISRGLSFNAQTLRTYFLTRLKEPAVVEMLPLFLKVSPESTNEVELALKPLIAP